VQLTSLYMISNRSIIYVSPHRWSSTSSSLGVFVYQTAKSIAPLKATQAVGEA
jgi:hypothetical protein